MRKVIVNSTPIILLAGINQLDLLGKLYNEIIIPAAVYLEVTAKTDSASQAIIERPSWLRVEQAPAMPDHYRRLVSAKLHAGELEVMGLALSKHADLVVLDDNAARKTAKFFGLQVTGTLGLLLRAKSCGMISEVKPLVIRLRENGFRMDDRVFSDVLKIAHET